MVVGDTSVDLTNPLAKRCAVFDGVDDYIHETAGGDVFSGKTEMTISVWFKPNTFTATNVYTDLVNEWQDFWAPHASNSYAVGFKSDKRAYAVIEFEDDTAKKVEGTTTLNTTQWHNIIFVYNGSSLLLYVNGNLENSVDYVGVISSSSRSLRFGKNKYNNYNGLMRDIKMYNRAITQEEVTKLSNNLNVTDGLIHHWKLAKDYNDSVGDKDGTNSGTLLRAVDVQVSQAISNARTTANDKYLISVINNKILTSVIEEAP